MITSLGIVDDHDAVTLRKLRNKVKPETCCNKKVRYFDIDSAILGISRIKDRNKRAGKLDVYRCPLCNYYHIGHGKQ